LFGVVVVVLLSPFLYLVVSLFTIGDHVSCSCNCLSLLTWVHWHWAYINWFCSPGGTDYAVAT
jgi:hypothetical protein